MTAEAGVPPNPDRVADRLAIEDVLALHSRGLDRLEKRDGQWKILHRQVVMDWSK
jgi:hypothetical protein